MSSDTDMESPPSIPPKTANPPCMFTVEQFQTAALSHETDSDSSNEYEYTVRPTAIWVSLAGFKKVVISEDNYRIHEIVTISRHDLPASPPWTAHILEIRGSKSLGQVFVRLFWFYQPSQLPSSLQHQYHGRRELLASNSMAVVDATAIVHRTRVSHWYEEHESVPAAGLFWRQTYDVQAQALSPLHTPCPPPCILHHNPDDPLIRCPLPGCNARMHKSCIVDSTLARVKAKSDEIESVGTKDAETTNKTTKSGAAPATSSTQSLAKSKKNGKNPRKSKKKTPSLTAKWTSDRSEGHYGVLITEGGRDWTEEVHCLGCGGVMG